MAATFFCASSAALVSGDSCLVIFSAAASAADFGFATAGSAAAAAPAPPLASAAAAGSPAAAGASPAATGSAAAAGAAPLPPAALGSTPASTPPIASAPLAPPAPAGGAADGAGGADRLPPRLPMAGRLTRLRTSPIASGMSSRCGATCSANCMMPTPSIAAAIITPARLDLDSRMSRVIIALPAPSCISCASSSSPASRHASAGLRRKRARNAGSTSRRSISFAATSASVAATATP